MTELGVATAAIQFFRSMGGSLAVAGLGALLTARLATGVESGDARRVRRDRPARGADPRARRSCCPSTSSGASDRAAICAASRCLQGHDGRRGAGLPPRARAARWVEPDGVVAHLGLAGRAPHDRVDQPLERRAAAAGLARSAPNRNGSSRRNHTCSTGSKPIRPCAPSQLSARRARARIEAGRAEVVGRGAPAPVQRPIQELGLDRQRVVGEVLEQAALARESARERAG